MRRRSPTLLAPDPLLEAGWVVPSGVMGLVLGGAIPFSIAAVGLGALTLLGALGLWTAIACFAFAQGIVLPIATPVLGALLAAGLAYAYRLIVEGQAEARAPARLLELHGTRGRGPGAEEPGRAPARRRRTRDLGLLLRPRRLHGALGGDDAARAGRVPEQLLHAHGRPCDARERHHRQVHRRRDHGALRGTARAEGPRALRDRRGARLQARARSGERGARARRQARGSPRASASTAASPSSATWAPSGASTTPRWATR
jgi:hypothetical protein